MTTFIRRSPVSVRELHRGVEDEFPTPTSTSASLPLPPAGIRCQPLNSPFRVLIEYWCCDGDGLLPPQPQVSPRAPSQAAPISPLRFRNAIANPRCVVAGGG